MKVAKIRNLIADMSDEEEIVCFWYLLDRMVI